MTTAKLRPVATFAAVAAMRLMKSAGTPARWRQASVPGTHGSESTSSIPTGTPTGARTTTTTIVTTRALSGC